MGWKWRNLTGASVSLPESKILPPARNQTETKKAMKHSYIILRKASNTTTFDSTFGGPLIPGPVTSMAAESSQPATVILPKIEIEELELNQVAKVRRYNDVIGAAPNMPVRLIKPTDAVPSDSDGNGMFSDTDSTWGIQAVGADKCSLEGEGMTAAVLDTGIDRSHPAFAGMNIVEKDFSGEDNGDTNGHGTHVAGTIFGQDVNGIRIGVARKIERALIGKVLGKNGGGTKETFEAIQWAMNSGANVISMSLGIDFPGFVAELTNEGFPTDLATSFALEGYRTNVLLYERLAEFMKQQANFMQTCIIVAAAGNENRKFQNPDWDISVAPPAVAAGIVSVGALARSSNGLIPAGFSNSGPNVVGPGVGVLSAMSGSQDLTQMNGTSMATPHVAGVTLLWAQQLLANGQLSPQFLEAKISASAMTTILARGFQAADVGLGLIQTPQFA